MNTSIMPTDVVKVCLNNQHIGTLWREEGEYCFQYLEAYAKNPNNLALSISLPLSPEKKTAKTLFPFFDGLIPEGWLLQIGLETFGLKPTQRWELLLNVGNSTVGGCKLEKVGLPSPNEQTG